MFNRAHIGFNRNAKWNRVIPWVKHYSTFMVAYIRTKLNITTDVR